MTITKDTAKTIICFGDSNTWGQIPGVDKRHPRSGRWPYILQTILGDDYEVVSEGLPGRTLVAVDPARPDRTGITYLKPLLESYDPVDLVIVMLGTNDVKSTYNLEAADIASHLEQTIELIKSGADLEKRPTILVVCPATPITPVSGSIKTNMTRAFEIFKDLPTLFKQVAEKHDCSYLAADDCASSSNVDGFHLDDDAHFKLAQGIADLITKIKL